MKHDSSKPIRKLKPIPGLIFASRWLQLPLYLGLILAQGVYAYHFWFELLHLLEAAFGNQAALQALVTSMGYQSEAPLTALNETLIMLVVLALIDVVMETDDAGLKLVEHIRAELNNRMMRLVIRTGQPGIAPERFVIDNFDHCCPVK